MRLSALRCLAFFVLVVTFAYTFTSANKHITGNPLNDDGLDNLRLAYSIAHFGTMANVLNMQFSEISPSNSREPVPNWITAQWIKLNENLFNDQTLHLSQTPKQLVKLKQVNTWILMGVLIGIFVLAYALFNAEFSPVTAFVLAYATLLLSYACIHTVYVTTMITEFHGALFVIWFSWAWLRFFQTNKWQYAAISGLFLGLLILTKAAFFYIAIVLLSVVSLWLALQKVTRLFFLKHLLVVFFAALVVLPWMYRNYIYIGTFEIAGRGPIVLMTRAFKSQMTDEEFKGAFYAYAPASLKKTMKSITGFSGKDRVLGGRLQRFTRFFPEDEACRARGVEPCAVGYYIQASIRYNNILKLYRQKYPNDPKSAVQLGEQSAKKHATNMIKNNLWGHLKSSLVFAWRGAWPCNKVDGRWFNYEQKSLQSPWQEIVPFFGLLMMFAMGILAAYKKDNSMIALTWLGCLTFLFYALTTHFIPRYSEMMLPIWVVCFVYCLSLVSKTILGQHLQTNHQNLKSP